MGSLFINLVIHICAPYLVILHQLLLKNVLPLSIRHKKQLMLSTWLVKMTMAMRKMFLKVYFHLDLLERAELEFVGT